jgi:hypothetical protein
MGIGSRLLVAGQQRDRIARQKATRGWLFTASFNHLMRCIAVRRSRQASRVQGAMVPFNLVIAFRSIYRRAEILSFIVNAAIRMPKLAIAVALFALVALAGTLTYAGFLVIGALAEYLGTGRLIAGLLLGVLFARVPVISKGKLRTAGLLPLPLRRPLMVSLPALCLLHFLMRSEYVPALFTGFAAVFLLIFPWIRRAIFGRMSSAFFRFTAGETPAKSRDDNVIDGEFREKKD